MPANRIVKTIAIFALFLQTRDATSVAPPHVPKATLPPVVTSNVCNMSLSSESESQGKTQVKCICPDPPLDVQCNYLGITELPADISFPKNVKVAKFQGNKIRDIKADTFYNGREILELDMSRNRIDFVSAESFQGFKNLIRLDLSHNKIWNIPVHVFQGLTDLRFLDLSYNDLVNVFQNTFEHLSELRELNLQSNPIENLEPKIFEHLDKMEVLNLEATMVQVVPDLLFVFTPKLRALSLASNRLTEVPSEALKVLDHLKLLNLNGNPIEVVRPEAFSGMIGLVALYMDRMPELTHIERFAFGDLVQLHELHCSHNYKLTDIDGAAFVRKTDNKKVALTQLFLRQNGLSTLSSQLLNWNEEVELYLRDNPWECDCHAEWMKHLKLKNNFQEHVRCAGPYYMENHVMSNLKDQDLTCGFGLSDIIMITCGVASGLLIILLIVAFIIWRRSYTGYSKPYYRVPKRKGVDDLECRGDDDMI